MADRSGGLACRCPCAGPAAAARAARRLACRSALFPAAASHDAPPARLLRQVLTGTVTDVTPHLLVVQHGSGEQRLPLAAGTAVWRGGLAEPTTLGRGEQVTVRLAPGQAMAADKVWASIGRVTGTITGGDASTVWVDPGPPAKQQAVLISQRAVSRIRVRFPRLEPGHPIDVIGLRRGTALEALVPAAAQPSPLAALPTRGPPAAGRVASVSGCATWHEPAVGGAGGDGVAYPAIDPATGCAAAASSPGSVMPYLDVGSLLHLRNDCTGAARMLQVSGCAAAARLFHDRCLACGPSPRGRIADLPMITFAELGGELERGCFNATARTGGLP
jgi:hypothetical protein